MSRAPFAGWYPLLLSSAALGIANSVIFSLLSNLQDKFGFSDAGLGLIAGSGFAVGLAGQLAFAPFADRGHAKQLMIAGLTLGVAGNILFASANSLALLVFARCVVGLSIAVFTPASRAIVVGVSGHDLARRLGTLSGVELAGFVTGPTIGGFLVEPYGIRVPFLVTAVVAAAAALMLATRHVPEPPRAARTQMAFDLLAIPGIRRGVLMSVALFAPVGFYDAVLDRFMTDLGASDRLIGTSFLLYGVPYALLAGLGGRASDRFGAMRVAVGAAVLVAPLTMLYGQLGSAVGVAGFSAVEGIVQSLGVPASQALVARSAPAGRAAAAQGLAGAANLLLGATAAYTAGSIYQRWGAGWMFVIAGSGVALFTLAAVAQREHHSTVS